MAKPKGHQCPECGAPRGADNTPSCACGERAAEALRDARTAEQAAAEDFDPLRIRPYVALDATTPDTPTEAGPPAELTLPLPPLPQPPAPPTTEATEPEARPRTSRRRTALLAASGAVITVAAAAGFASGLFSYEPPTRDGAAPESVREAVPQARTTQPQPNPSPTATTSSGTTPTPQPLSPTPTPTPTPPQTLTTPPASPTPSLTPPQSPPPTARTTDSLTPSDRDEPAPTLREGDSGPEVTELQLRLRQLYLYNDDPHGHYTREVEHAVRNYQWARGVQTDELGVYGEETRQKLESETSEP
ncbi:peptidoglycan-binding protein [Streptomyces spinoverrucosus]|uniref:peptidoglycan-binding domain-containing protein n=1 Tax=Streptomyces spinoverrucosus TaxID=284043 RepID=UPI0018C3C605|nr:peptidoglycan-binding protein [Streptomyces spinoverrucosus]MBG0855616.1 peptidoglycan-binding protein [Streptomyces spinoverrucosus]